MMPTRTRQIECGQDGARECEDGPEPFPPSRSRVFSGKLFLATAAMVVLVASCSVSKNYKVLSFFFDGVPDPNAPAHERLAPGQSVDIERSPTYSFHPPWKEEKCEECHTRTLKMGSKDSDLCLKCHAGKLTEHEHMHGPVAVGACLWCHNPHNSAFSHLLKDQPRLVCSQCHTPGTLSVDKVPEHGQEDKSCIECHHGHGGDQRFFLRSPGERK